MPGNNTNIRTKTMTFGKTIAISDLTEGLQVQQEDGSSYHSSFLVVDKKLIFYTTDKPARIEPGVFSIRKIDHGMVLVPTQYSEDAISHSYLSSIDAKFDTFFNKLHVYKECGVKVPVRRILLYGPAGTGKTSKIISLSQRYVVPKKTAVLIWDTSNSYAGDIKTLLGQSDFSGIEHMILVIEDLSGVERTYDPNPAVPADTLSLLDNKEELLRVPTLIVATTNHIENLPAEVTNRPGRFNEKIMVDYPTAEERISLMTWMYKQSLPAYVHNYLRVTKKLTPDHLNEALMRTKLYDLTLIEALVSVKAEIDDYNANYADKKKGTMGLSTTNERELADKIADLTKELR